MTVDQATELMQLFKESISTIMMGYVEAGNDTSVSIFLKLKDTQLPLKEVLTSPEYTTLSNAAQIADSLFFSNEFIARLSTKDYELAKTFIPVFKIYTV